MPSDEDASLDSTSLAQKGGGLVLPVIGKRGFLEVAQKADDSPDEKCDLECDSPVETVAFEAAKRRVGLGASPIHVGGLMIANTLLGGSGLLVIPYAFSQSGYILGLLLMVFFGSSSAFGSHLLHCTARRLGRAPCSFYSVTSTVAPSWVWLIDGAVMVKCFGVATSYLIITGDLAPDALNYFGVGNVRRWQCITAGFAIAGPLSCLRDLSALRYTAAASILIVAWIAVVLALFFLRAGPSFQPCSSSVTSYLSVADAGSAEDLGMRVAMSDLPCGGADFKPFTQDMYGLARVLPIFVFNFTCQQNIFAICNEVKQATGRRLDRVITVSYCASGFAIALVALLGYATFGDQVASDVLKVYPKNAVVEVTHLLISFLVIASFPVQAHPSRNSALALLRPILGGSVNSTIAGLDPNPERVAAAAKSEERLFQRVTVVLLFASYALALSVEDLGKILAMVGASGSTAVSYILPGLLYTRTFPRGTWKWLFAMALLVGGCIVAPVCLYVIIFGGGKGH